MDICADIVNFAIGYRLFCSRFFICMKKYLLCLLFFTLLPCWACARRSSPKDAYADSVMHLIFHYAQTVDTTGRTAHTSCAYTKFQLRTNRRNALLMLVPTMYAVAHGGGRKFVSEYYNRMSHDANGKLINKRLLGISTIPHRSRTMEQALRYMTPNVYEENLFQENILSPFHRSNRMYYKYSVTPLPFGMAQVYAYPRIKNTQTVLTRAIVDSKTGKISMVDFEGEYDMTRFFISVKMGAEGFKSLVPKKCDMRANFRFLGNKIVGRYVTVYDLPDLQTDSLKLLSDTAFMARVRPEKLNQDEESIYQSYYKACRNKDTLTHKENNFVKDVLWDMVGDNMLNRISQDFGKENQGYFKLSPIFNPLYMGYSERKGLVYKFDLRMQYAFDHNFLLSLQFKGGYSMRQHRFYFRLPLIFRYNNLHEGYFKAEMGNGNHITTNRVARKFVDTNTPTDTISNYEFKNDYLKLTNHWRFNQHLAFEVGLVNHKRLAVNPAFYTSHGYPSSYKSSAPTVGIQWSPKGKRGPVLTLDYERGIKGLLGSNIDYERVEMDAQSIFYSSRRRSYSLRVGSGFYTRKGDHWDFVDYTNFHDNNIPGGWNDDWSGEFELLSSQWYNASDYYVRTNFTYEAPMLAVAWVPLIGRFVEKERLYVSSLVVRHLHPYSELGYGVTTRLMTLGVFAAFHNASFDGIGCRFGFELFRNW